MVIKDGRRIQNSSRGYIGYTNINVLLVCIVLFAINTLILKSHIPWFNNYFNDLLAIPLLLAFSNLLFMVNHKSMRMYHSLIILIISSWVWEYGYFIVFGKGTVDVIDILMYCIGFCIYNLLHLTKVLILYRKI